MKRIFRVLFLFLICAGVYIFWPTRPSSSQLDTLVTKSKNLEFSGTKYAVLIDYTRPVLKKRLWLIHLATKRVVLNCHVSHAKKSGWLWPRKFSNKLGSEFSCTGTFKTLNTYKSNYGEGIYKFGLRIQGLDKENSNTLARNIVFHTSFPLWSKGCFMTTSKNNKLIIDKLDSGSLVLVLK